MTKTPRADAAYEAGQQANYDGLRADQNPHRLDAYIAQWWQQGWQHAQIERQEWEELCDAGSAP